MGTNGARTNLCLKNGCLILSRRVRTPLLAIFDTYIKFELDYEISFSSNKESPNKLDKVHLLQMKVVRVWKQNKTNKNLKKNTQKRVLHVHKISRELPVRVLIMMMMMMLLALLACEEEAKEEAEEEAEAEA
jgi:hypothetical protein